MELFLSKRGGMRWAIAHAKYAIGYASTCAWAAILLFSPVFGSPSAEWAAVLSMLPGLVACLCSVLLFRSFPSIGGRTAFVTVSAFLMALGTLLCTYPDLSCSALARVAGLVLSGFFAIILVMSWFDAYSQLTSRGIIVLSGCAVALAAVLCWGVLLCESYVASVIVSLLPMVSFVLLPASAAESSAPETAGLTVRDIVGAAVPVRTLVGLAITFFVVSSIGSLAPEFGRFVESVDPLSLLVPLGVTVFFIASAFFVRQRVDPSIFYKVLLCVFAAMVLLLAFSIGISAPLVLYSYIIADVMMWAVLALWAKRTPVKPHLVFAFGWIAECIGSTIGQTVAPLLAAHLMVFLAVSVMLILLAVGFAFSEGKLMLDVDEGCQAGAANASGEENQAAVVGGAGATWRSVASDGVGATRQTAAADEAGGAGGVRGGNSEVDKADADGKAGNADGGCASNVGEGCASDSGDVAPAQDAASRLGEFASVYGLSPRECEVLALWVSGRSLKYIEGALFISESTLKTHLRNIYRKCDTHNRDEVISLYECFAL